MKLTTHGRAEGEQQWEKMRPSRCSKTELGLPILALLWKQTTYL
jgi:hypothetical protein